MQPYALDKSAYAIEAEKGELSFLEEQVMKCIKDNEPLPKNVNIELEQQKLSFGDRLADRFVEVCGTWGFIIKFLIVLFIWIIINSVVIIWKVFDPYPFIFLNLVLSCLSAIQAPIILMSQRRQDEKDRLRAEYDYQINLKAELEIRSLHEKIDHILENQWQKLLQIQKLQIDIMEEVRIKQNASANK